MRWAQATSVSDARQLNCGCPLVASAVKKLARRRAMFPVSGSTRMHQSRLSSTYPSDEEELEVPLHPVHDACIPAVTPIMSVVILIMELVALASAPVLQAQEFPVDVARGKAVYERHCLRCHGAGGWGDGPEAGTLKIQPTNFHAFKSFLKSDEELVRAIEYGIVFSPMHTWRGKLSDSEMQDVTAHIRRLSQQER
jgi:cytochrome c553